MKFNQNSRSIFLSKLIVFLLSIVCFANIASAQIKIILKLDDVIVKNGSSAATPTLDYIVTKKIKATIGAVAIKFDGSGLGFLAPYLNATNNNNEKLFEVWHHGYDHVSPEFIGTGYAFQKLHFENADDSIKNNLRLQMHSFGAPFNHNDTITNRVIAENANYKVTMFNDPAVVASTGILNLSNRVNMENGTGLPQYNFFVANYNAAKTTFTDYMVLQGHPNVWNNAQLTQFSQIIDFLISENCVFVQPYEYYLSLNPSTPIPAQSQTITFPIIAGKVVGDADFNPSATASSGLPVVYNSSNNSVAIIVNGNVHIVGAGTAIITASQEGNATFNPADYVSQIVAVNAIDYRSAATGNWNAPATWEARSTSGTWATATSIPTAANNVYIQNGHTVTVNSANVYCYNLHINIAGVLAIGNNSINVSGKIRAYSGNAVTGTPADGTFYTTQVNSTALASNMITTNTSGLLKFVGASRNITNTGEWAGAGTANFTEFALDSNAIGVLGTAIKFRTITISSGTISATTTINVGTSMGTGNLTIKSGAKLMSARVWTGTAGSQAITYNSATKMGVLQIDNGGTLEFTGAASAIDCTTFTNNGTVVYSGSAQTLLTTSAATNAGIGSAIPNAYTNLIINGSGTKTLSTATSIAGVLSVNSGKLSTGSNNLTLGGSAVFAPATSLIIAGGVTDFANKNVTLESAISESSIPENAAIETIAGTLNNATNVTIQQAIPSGYRKYRFLSHPFNAAQPLSSLTDNIDITGVGGNVNGFTSTPTNNPSAYYFTTANANGNTYDGGWSPFTSATTNSWAVGQGVRVLVRGSKSQTNSLTNGAYTPDEVTLDMTGPINIGNVSVPLSSAGTGSTQGFNLVGNPYPSPVDIGAVLTATSNIGGNSFYVRNPQIGSYITVSPIPSSYMLPANTSFFVKATANTNLNFTEVNKAACTSCATVFRNTNQSSIQFKILKKGVEYDNLVIQFNDKYKEAYEQNADAIKLMNDELSIYAISSDNHNLAADYRRISTLTIPLGISLSASYGKQQYQLIVSDYTALKDKDLYLHDKLNDTYMQITNGAFYTLDIDPLNNLSIGNNRLEIVSQKKAVIANITNDFFVNAVSSPNEFIIKYSNVKKGETNIKLLNVAGQIVERRYVGQQQNGQVIFSTTQLPQGLYLIEVEIGANKIVKKLIK